MLLSFKSWIDFQDAYPTLLKKEKDLNEINEENVKPVLTKKIIRISYIVAIIVLLIILLLYKFNTPKQSIVPISVTDSISFTPTEISINYNASKLKSDSLFVCFNDIRSPNKNRIYLNKDKIQYIHSYVIPGYFPIQFFLKNKIFQTNCVYVKSEKWIRTFLFRPIGKTFYDIIIDQNDNDTSGVLYTKTSTPLSYGISMSQYYWTEYRYFNNIDANGDQCLFEASLSNNSATGGIEIFDVIINIVCEKDTLRTHFINPGCTHWCKVQISDLMLSGSETNLSAFGFEFKGFHKTSIRMVRYPILLLITQLIMIL